MMKDFLILFRPYARSPWLIWGVAPLRVVQGAQLAPAPDELAAFAISNELDVGSLIAVDIAASVSF